MLLIKRFMQELMFVASSHFAHKLIRLNENYNIFIIRKIRKK